MRRFLKNKSLFLILATTILISCLLCGCTNSNETEPNENKYETYLLQDFSFDGYKTQAENNTIAKQAMEKDKANIINRFKTIKSTEIYGFNDQSITFSTIMNLEEPAYREIEYSHSPTDPISDTLGQIKFTYTYYNSSDLSNIDVDEIANDIQSVFGKLENSEEFKNIVTKNISLVQTTDGYDEIEEFKTESGVVINAYFVCMGMKYIEITGEYKVDLL